MTAWWGQVEWLAEKKSQLEGSQVAGFVQLLVIRKHVIIHTAYQHHSSNHHWKKNWEYNSRFHLASGQDMPRHRPRTNAPIAPSGTVE